MEAGTGPHLPAGSWPESCLACWPVVSFCTFLIVFSDAPINLSAATTTPFVYQTGLHASGPWLPHSLARTHLDPGEGPS
ncbi:unnamed protein product [Protopolystoma xenopodis]|uniref:Uncharacterized protein n=1 Tax=Protopolystoma xenopodis TaxID=117903 RepID=A0A448WAW3_9PLAT|nr:unnamed protein product [Protopolystoma xenopodis]